MAVAIRFVFSKFCWFLRELQVIERHFANDSIFQTLLKECSFVVVSVKIFVSGFCLPKIIFYWLILCYCFSDHRKLPIDLYRLQHEIFKACSHWIMEGMQTNNLDFWGFKFILSIIWLYCISLLVLGFFHFNLEGVYCIWYEVFFHRFENYIDFFISLVVSAIFVFKHR